jgi:tetratricopeptide (TPR) repeat protein
MADIHATSPAPASGRRAFPLRKLGLLGLALVLLLIVMLAGAAYAGYQAGQSQRETDWQATQAVEIEHQYDLGLADLAGGRYEVAVARFEYVLQLDPNHPEAGQKLAEAQASLAATATPRPTAATAEVTATPAATEDQAAANIFAEAEARLAEQDWDGVIEALTRLHSVDIDYEAVRADGMLFLALRNRGVARIQGDAMEAGMFDLDQAEAFGPLDSEALNLRAWARMYLAGRSYWGLDWFRTMEIFEELSLVAPYFRDTDRRLFESVWRYADQLVVAGDYCGAAERYERALLVRADDSVSAKLTAAQEGCANPPPPELGAEGTAAPATAEGTPSP